MTVRCSGTTSATQEVALKFIIFVILILVALFVLWRFVLPAMRNR